MDTPDPKPPVDPPTDRELDLKEREVAAKEKEATAKEREVGRSRWSMPLVVGLLGTTAGLFVNVFVTSANNAASLSVERQREQSNLVLEAIKTKDPNDVCKNLVFFVKLKLLDDPNHAITDQCKSAPKGLPSLPPATVSSPPPATVPEISSKPEPMPYRNPELLKKVTIGISVMDSSSMAGIAGASLVFTQVSPFSQYAPKDIPPPLTTAQGGNVSLSLIPGSYTVLVSKDGYKPLPRGFSVHDVPFPVDVLLVKIER